jgi:hypothetical protein
MYGISLRSYAESDGGLFRRIGLRCNNLNKEVTLKCYFRG